MLCLGHAFGLAAIVSGYYQDERIGVGEARGAWWCSGFVACEPRREALLVIGALLSRATARTLCTRPSKSSSLHYDRGRRNHQRKRNHRWPRVYMVGTIGSTAWAQRHFAAHQRSSVRANVLIKSFYARRDNKKCTVLDCSFICV